MALITRTRKATPSEAGELAAETLRGRGAMLVLDLRLRDQVEDCPALHLVPKELAEDLLVLDLFTDRWFSLFSITPGCESIDLAGLARAIETWGDPWITPWRWRSIPIGTVGPAISAPELLLWLYTNRSDREGVLQPLVPTYAPWGQLLRDLPWCVLDDALFQRLTLGGNPRRFEHDVMIVPGLGRLPPSQLLRLIHVVIDRFLHARSERTGVRVFAIGAPEKQSLVTAALERCQRIIADRAADIACELISSSEMVAMTSKLAPALAQLSRLKFARDAEIAFGEMMIAADTLRGPSSLAPLRVLHGVRHEAYAYDKIAESVVIDDIAFGSWQQPLSLDLDDP